MGLSRAGGLGPGQAIAPAMLYVPNAGGEPAFTLDAAQPQRLRRAGEDLRLGLARWRLAWALARLDIRNRYRGSVLGPFWLTVSTGAMLLGLGLLYANLFSLDLAAYLPHLAVSLIVWNLIAQVINEGCTSITSSEGMIRQVPLPYTVHALRCTLRSTVIAAHNLPLIVITFAIFRVVPGPEALLSLVGLGLLTLNGFAAALLLGMVCARFRDIGPIVGSVLQLAFFMTPVIWKPELLGERAAWLPLNPFYAILETIRGPLVEGGGPSFAWIAAIAYTVLNCGVTFAFFVRFRGRIAFWV